MMKRFHFFRLSTFFTLSWVVFLGFETAQAQNPARLRFAFYNVENFFDIETDSTRDYNAFTPDGDQHWTLYRFFQKRNNIFKTLVALGQGTAPALVGFCEVENDLVLQEVIYRTPLKSAGYGIVHYESPDRRGIDVGLIYRKEFLRLVTSQPIPVSNPDDSSFLTRDILFAGFETPANDTVFVYINHWPSRYGGQVESMDKRMLAAKTLRQHYDSLLEVLPKAKVIMMGDFNDTPLDPSLVDGLQTKNAGSDYAETDLIQLFFPGNTLGYEGTLKHGHSWQIFDQIIVSPQLYLSEKGTGYCRSSATIFAADFLMENDDRNLGKKLNRTYMGPTYIGGYSDHLPVYIDLCFPK